MLSTTRLALRLIDRRSRRRFFMGIPVAIAIALIEGVALTLLLPILQVVASDDIASAPERFAVVGDVVGSDDANTIMLVMIALVFGLMLLKTLATAGYTYWQLKVLNAGEADLATEMFARYISAPVSFHAGRNSADAIQITNSAINAVFRNVLVPVTALMSDVAVLAAIGVALFAADPVVTAVSAGYFGLVALGYVFLVSAPSERLGQQTTVLNSTVTQLLQEGLQGVKTIQAMGAEELVTEEFRAVRVRWERVRRSVSFLTQAPSFYLDIALVVGVALAGSVVAATSDRLEALAFLTVLIAAAFRALPSLSRVLSALNSVRLGRAGVDLVRDINVDLDREASLVAFAASRLRQENDSRPGLTFSHVSYTYADGRVGLCDVSFHVALGEAIGVVGPSGAGKSTLVGIVLGLMVPTEGSVIVNGAVLVPDTGRKWRERVGYVSQDVFMTNDSLRANVAFGVAAADIDDERVRRALVGASLADWLERAPNGLDTMLGEGGARLSGGERQRVAFARALYRRPDLLVLDEATSALDVATENELVELLDALHGEVTTIRVAHHLSTTRSCDRLIFLAGGRVADIGSFAELEARSPHFAQLVRLETITSPNGASARPAHAREST